MTPALLLALALAHGPAVPAAPAPATAVHLEARSTPAANVVTASLPVRGTLRALREVLHTPARWPGVFTDARALTQRPSGAWSVDFAAFGHAHDFTLVRTDTGVMWTLAQEGHGAARLEYALRPLDAQHVTLSVRFVVPTPPGLTPAQALALLRAKATADLESFARAAAAGAPPATTRN